MRMGAGEETRVPRIGFSVGSGWILSRLEEGNVCAGEDWNISSGLMNIPSTTTARTGQVSRSYHDKQFESMVEENSPECHLRCQA